MTKYLKLFSVKYNYFLNSQTKSLWSILVNISIWYNLLYVVGFITALMVLFSMPLNSYINILPFVFIPILTLLVNLKLFGKMIKYQYSILAVLLNLVCLVYFIVKPEYLNQLIQLLVFAGPIVNIVVLTKIFLSNCQIKLVSNV